METTSSLGYIVYLGAVLVPGVGLSTLLGVWTDSDGLVARLAYVIGVGLSVDTVAMAISTSGLSMAGVVFRGVWGGTSTLLILFGAVAFATSLLLRRRLPKFPRPSASDLAVIGTMAFAAIITIVYFQSYPIFPIRYSIDLGNHLHEVSGLINGSRTSIPSEVLYGGAAYQLALGVLAVRGIELVTIQRIMGVLVVLSPPLVYLASLRLTSSERAALLATLMYSLSGTVWALMVFSTGLYSNFYGVFASLFLVVAFVDLTRKRVTLGDWILLALVIGGVYFSHFTLLALLPVFATVGVIGALRHDASYKSQLKVGVLLLAPGAVGALLLPRVVGKALGLAFGGGGFVFLNTAVSSILAPLPSLSYLAAEVNNDLGFVALVFLFAVGTYFAFKRRSILLGIPIIWAFLLLGAAPLNNSAWRYSLEAIVPITLVAGYGLHELLPKSRPGKRRRAFEGDNYRFAVLGLILLFLLPIAAPGWATSIVTSNQNATSVTRQTQVYAAISWLGENTPPGSRYLSLTEPLFIYGSLLIHGNFTFEFLGSPSAASQFAAENNYTYVIVTRLAIVPTGAATQGLPWNTFTPSTALQLVYNSSDVRVFQVS